MPQSVERTAQQILELLTGVAQGAGAQSLEASFEAIRDALAAALGAGNNPPDPLILQQWVSIGANPAESGEVRLKAGGEVASRNAADSADVRLLRGASYVQGLNTYDLVRLGQSVVIDDDNEDRVTLLATPLQVVATLDYGDGTFNTVRRARVGAGDVTLQDGAGNADVQLSPGDAPNQTAVVFIDLPTADPVESGRVFTMDAVGLAAALAAGARYLLISP